MKRRGISVRSLFIGFFTIVFFVCSVLSLGLMSKKMKTVSAATDKVEVYQLAPNNGYLMQSYVIKTANGKLVVIDGGTDGVFATDVNYPQYESGVALAAEAYLPAALRAIAGKTAAEEVEVDAWFLSHAHRDHFSELSKVLSDSESNVKINNFYFDFPDFGGDFPMVNSQQANLDALKEAFAGAGYDYDALNGAVVNADSVAKGLTITVDGVHFDVLQTWDMSDGYYDEVNDTSMVLRMRVGDNSVLFLNDLWLNGGRRLTEKYTAEQLASDYVQISHHGHAGVSKAQYDKMGITASTKLLWPTPCVTFNNATEFFVDETYEWFNETSYVLNGVVDATKVDKERNFFACLYDAYPTDMTSVDAWKTCVAGMMVASFEYVDTTFEVLGAAVRTADPDGIRFVAQLNTQTLSSYGSVKYGMMLLPEDMDNGADLTVTYDGATYTPSNQNAIVIEGGDFWSEDLRAANGIKEGYSAFSCALLADQGDGSSVVKFPEAFYNRPITAVAFVIKESGEVIYTEKVTRSISYVAAVESLKSTYEENEIVEAIVSGAQLSLSVNDGATLGNLYKVYAPTLTIGGMPVSTFAAISVTYTSDNEAAAKVVDGKVQPVANGVANITATIQVNGEKTISATTEVTVAVTDDTVDTFMINDCENIGGWVQSNGTVSASTDYVTEDTQSAMIEFTGWGYFDLRVQNPCPALVDVKMVYESISFDVCFTSDENEILNIFDGDQQTVVAQLEAGTPSTITIDTDDLVNGVNFVDDGSDGRFLRFYVGGACSLYVDNVVATMRSSIVSEQLAAPSVQIWNDGTAVWNAVEGATAYAYTIDGLNLTVTNQLSVKCTGNSVVKVKALGDGVYYSDSDFSETVQYVQKDLLNDCEYNLSYWVASGGTITLNASNATQGYFSYGITATGWTYLNLWLRKDNVILDDLNDYQYLEMTVNVESDDNCTLYGADQNTVLTTLTNGLQIVRIPVADIESSGTYKTGATNGNHLTFYLGGAVAFYLDNVVGVRKTIQEASDTELVVNGCETASDVDVLTTATTVKVTTTNASEGTNALQITFTGWNYLNIYLGMDCETLQATYDTISFDVTTEEIMTLFRKDERTSAVSLVAGESATVTLNTADLTQDGDFTGNYLTLWAGGAGVIYLDNVVGYKAATQTLCFGNTFILGDSYSTFEGWLPHGYLPWYNEGCYFSTNGATDVRTVEQTWWHQLLTQTGSNLVEDCAYSGTTICNAESGWAGTDETWRSFITRFITAVNEGKLKDVDTIFLYGGTNDFWLGSDNVPKGEPIYSDWTEDDLKKTYPALCYLITIMQYHAPEARIVVLCNTNALAAETDGLETFHTIAEYYGVEYVDLTYGDGDLAAGHPTVQGMTMTKDTILSTLSAD